MSGRLDASEKGIYIRVEDEAAPRAGVASKSSRHAVAAVQAVSDGGGSALYAEGHSTTAGTAAVFVRGHGELIRVERWNGTRYVPVAIVDSAGVLDVAGLLVNGAPIEGAGPFGVEDITGLQTALDAKQGGDADLTTIGGLTPTNDDVLQRKAGAWANRSLTQLKTDLGLPAIFGIACSDETTTLTTGNAKATFRLPQAMTLTAVRASLTTASSSGLVTVDINEAGTTVLSTKLTIDQGEKTSTTAATAAVISDSALADDAEITVDIDGAGATATGLKVWLIGTRAWS